MKKIYLFLLFITLFGFTNAQKNDIANRPRLIVNIAIDGLRSDYLSMFWNDLDASGFRKLIMNGSYCKNMTFPYLSCGNAADYASVFTGTIPSDHGISGDTYFEPKTKRELSCVFDIEKKGVAGGAQVSPKNLMTSTFTDELKLNTQGKAKIITIALNPEEAVIMAGHSGNGTVWIDENSGNWMSSNYYGPMLPDWAIKANNVSQVQNNIQRNWSNLYVGSNYKANSAQNGVTSFFAYPMLETLGKNNSYKKFKESPFANTMVRELAVSAFKDEFIGLDDSPDVLNLQFSVRGFDQASSGILTAEIQDMYLRVDKDIKVLMDTIEATCGAKNVLYVVYAPQTEYTSPQLMKSFNVPSGYFVVDRSLSLLNTYLMAIYGQGDFVQGYANRHIYLDKEEIASKKLNYKEVEQKVTDFMNRFAGIQYAVKAVDLQNLGCDNNKIQMAKNAYNKNKSGDIILFLQPGWVDVPTETEKVGLSSRINNYAPFILSGWKVKRQLIVTPFSVIDIAPTICNLLNTSYPNSNMGKPVLDIVP